NYNEKVLYFSITIYILMVPSVLQSSSPDQACLQLHSLNESVSVSVILEYSGSNTTIFEQPVRGNYFFQCITFMVRTLIYIPIKREKVILENVCDQTMHWEREVKPPAETFPSFYSRAPSAEVEMTSYVLLAVLHKPKRAQKDLTFASQIVQWIIRQQNSNGGFSSTQDTVIALQALADYGAATYSKNGQNTVKISSSKPFEKVFEVNSQNRLLLQQSSLPDVPGNYILEVNGSGCVFVQTTLRYNILLPKKTSGFSLSVQTANASCADSFRTKFDIILSTSYAGKRNISNMAIIDVKMLSGFVPISSSLQKVRNVMQVETKQNHVLFYLESVSWKTLSFSFSVEQDLLVFNIKPASVLIYDYYETGRRALFRPHTECGGSVTAFTKADGGLLQLGG
uniref:Alpha-macroglobulin receptor-binding domain-containing protein n=1 Tax=Chelydra serpentina TaxID=8475 RepID=A0A8C3SJ67_CHESE